jgi:hypothetical protein
MQNEKTLVQQISKRYGPVIDLNANPGTMIDIIRLVRSMYDAEPGTPDGGGGPTGPTSRQGGVTNEEILKAVLTLTREVRVGGRTRRKPARVRSATAKRRSR